MSSLARRFWAKVEKTYGCWLWTGARNASGYGKIFVDGRFVPAHRVSYELAHRQVPTGLDVDHLCRNPQCVNPAHLEAVSHRENLLRGETIAAANARKSHCPQGHEYSLENTHITKAGIRQCRRCDADRKARRRAARKGEV